jgi:hypothetical protein
MKQSIGLASLVVPAFEQREVPLAVKAVGTSPIPLESSKHLFPRAAGC